MAGNDEYAKLLIHSDTIDDSQTFIDSSSSGHTITVNNWPSHQTDQKKFGSTAIHFRHLMNMDDAFTGNNGDLPDREKWKQPGTQTEGTIYNNKLRQTASAGTTNVQNRTRYGITGDFDFQVGFDVSSNPDTDDWFSMIRVWIDSSHYCYLQRAYYNSTHYYRFIYDTGGGAAEQNTVTTDTSGYLRVWRGGSSWIAYYWDAGWQQIGSTQSISSDDLAYVDLQTYVSDGNPTVTTDWDGFQWNESTEPSVPVTEDYLSIADSTDWDFGSGDFTIDFWMYPTNLTEDYPSPIGVRANGSADYAAVVYAKHASYSNHITAYLKEDDDTPIPLEGNVEATLNTWQHIALVRHGNTGILFKDGTSIGTVDLTGVTLKDPGGLIIGTDGAATSKWFSGYMDEIRISKGIARWTSNFTPPARAYGGFGFGSKTVDTFEFGNKVSGAFIFGV